MNLHLLTLAGENQYPQNWTSAPQVPHVYSKSVEEKKIDYAPKYEQSQINDTLHSVQDGFEHDFNKQ